MFWRTVLGLMAVGAAFAPVPPVLIERTYAQGIFPFIQPRLTTFSNLTSVALFDVLLLIVVGGVALLTLGDVRSLRRRGWWRSLLRVATRLATVAAAAYLAFLATWGLNYRRVPLSTRLDFSNARVSAESLNALASTVVGRVNALYEPAHGEGPPQADSTDHPLADAFARVQRVLGSQGRFVPGRPKPTLLDGYFRRAGVSGMTDPYFLETLVATDLLAIERPMVIAHEWSHLAGIADEGSANFAGWLTCVRGSPLHQYSGWLFLYSEIASALPLAEARRIAADLGPGPRGDLAAIRDRLLRHVSPVMSTAGWRVYDQYLKANRVSEGTASYGEVVRLVLGTNFAPDWTPRLR